jgi:hypothetical protein
MDIAGLSKLSADTLVLIVSVLGFMVGPEYKFVTLILNTCDRHLALPPKNLKSQLTVSVSTCLS